jgi:hypothetical protein
MTESPNAEKPDRGWPAREANRYIRSVAKTRHDNRPIGFFCECGCREIAVATLERYEEQGGVWIDGHKHD